MTGEPRATPPPAHLPAMLFVVLLAGCAGFEPDAGAAPTTFYDSAIHHSASGQPVSLADMAGRLADADVILVGEYHGHQAAHLLQARLQAALHRQHPDQVLAMEPFDVDHQAVIEAYLAGELGEEELIEDADAWSNYKASYRPLMEFARHHRLPVVAANAPGGVVRCVGRQGPGYLDSLPPATGALLPERPFRDVAGYREKFLDTLGGSDHGSPSAASRDRLENAYQAQLLRDNTMADRILQARQRYPGHQVLMVTGAFHIQEGLGLAGVLEQREPELDTVVISPVTLDAGGDRLPDEHVARGDYVYLVQPLPERYHDPEREQADMAEQFSQAGKRECRQDSPGDPGRAAEGLTGFVPFRR